MAKEMIEMGVGAHSNSIGKSSENSEGVYLIEVDIDAWIKDITKDVFGMAENIFNTIKDQIPDRHGVISGKTLSTGGIANLIEMVIKAGVKVVGIFFELLLDLTVNTFSAIFEFILQPIFAAIAAAFAAALNGVQSALATMAQVVAAIKLSQEIKKVVELAKKIQQFLTFEWVGEMLKKMGVKGPIPEFKIPLFGFEIPIPEIKNDDLDPSVKDIHGFGDIIAAASGGVENVKDKANNAATQGSNTSSGLMSSGTSLANEGMAKADEGMAKANEGMAKAKSGLEWLNGFQIGNFLINPIGELMKVLPNIEMPTGVTSGTPSGSTTIEEDKRAKFNAEYDDLDKRYDLIFKTVKYAPNRCQIYSSGSTDTNFSWFKAKYGTGETQNILDDLYWDISHDTKLSKSSTASAFANDIKNLIKDVLTDTDVNYEIDEKIAAADTKKFWYDPTLFPANWNNLWYGIDSATGQDKINKMLGLILDVGGIMLNQPKKYIVNNQEGWTVGFGCVSQPRVSNYNENTGNSEYSESDASLKGKCKLRDYAIRLFGILIQYGDTKSYYNYFNEVTPVLTKLGELGILNIPKSPDVNIPKLDLKTPSLTKEIMDKIPEKLSVLLKKINMIKTIIMIPLNIVLDKVNQIIGIITKLISFDILGAFSDLMKLIGEFIPTPANLKEMFMKIFKPLIDKILGNVGGGKEALESKMTPPSGTSGISGSSGLSGTSGLSVTSGSSGIPGSSGISGVTSTAAGLAASGVSFADKAANVANKAMQATGAAAQTIEAIMMFIDLVVRVVTEVLPNILLEIFMLCASKTVEIITGFIPTKLQEIADKFVMIGIPAIIPIPLESVFASALPKIATKY